MPCTHAFMHALHHPVTCTQPFTDGRAPRGSFFVEFLDFLLRILRSRDQAAAACVHRTTCTLRLNGCSRHAAACVHHTTRTLRFKGPLSRRFVQCMLPLQHPPQKDLIPIGAREYQWLRLNVEIKRNKSVIHRGANI